MSILSCDMVVQLCLKMKFALEAYIATEIYYVILKRKHNVANLLELFSSSSKQNNGVCIITILQDGVKVLVTEMMLLLRK